MSPIDPSILFYACVDSSLDSYAEYNAVMVFERVRQAPPGTEPFTSVTRKPCPVRYREWRATKCPRKSRLFSANRSRNCEVSQRSSRRESRGLRAIRTIREYAKISTVTIHAYINCSNCMFTSAAGAPMTQEHSQSVFFYRAQRQIRVWKTPCRLDM